MKRIRNIIPKPGSFRKDVSEKGSRREVSIRFRVLFSFLSFSAVLIMILCLALIVFFGDFYKIHTIRGLRSASTSVAENINSSNLSSLVSKIAGRNDFCILILDSNYREVFSVDTNPACVLHRISKRSLVRDYTRFLDSSNNSIEKIYSMLPVDSEPYRRQDFKGNVPSDTESEIQSMVICTRVETKTGPIFVFLNAQLTPLTATYETVVIEIAFISIILIVMSFMISILLSNIISKPILQTTESALELGKDDFCEPPVSGYKEIDSLNRTLSKASKDLNLVSKQQRELIANISHDLRTPLTLIEGYAEAMRDIPGENTPENMQIVIDETERLSGLVNSVLQLNDLIEKNYVSNPEIIEVDTEISNICKRYRKLLSRKGYYITFTPCDTETYIYADKQHFEQVVLNLLNNAVTYTGVDHNVFISAVIKGFDKVRISITDTGKGIPQDELPHIWERYYRGTKPHKRATVGSGIGLSIVKRILEKEAESFGVDSHEELGSTFWFEMKINN